MTVDRKLVHSRGARPAGVAPIDVISVQSQVVYGHVGNSAAAEPLRQLGLCVVEVPTTLLSNAPVYPTTRGRVLPADWVADLLLGVEERSLPARARMLLSGYLGTAAIGTALADWIDQVLPRYPQLRYCRDPVLGDLAAPSPNDYRLSVIRSSHTTGRRRKRFRFRHRASRLREPLS